MKEPSEVNFELTSPFEYAFKGEQREAMFITLSPPTMLQHSQAAYLKQSITRIIASVVEDVEDDEDEDEDVENIENKKTEKKDDDTITPKMVINTIYSSACVDANVVWEQAKALFKEGVALIDGEQKVTAPLIKKMSTADFENMVGAYIANFTLASAEQ